jgi:outer membrane protein assembly factor BamB
LIFCSMKKVKMFGLAQFLVFLSLAHIHAQEPATGYWTRFRGMDGMGIEPQRGMQVPWDASRTQWDIALPGEGHSSPVVWGSTIFATSVDHDRNLGHVMAVDEQDGRILWQKEFQVGDLTMHVDNNQASVTPAVDESQLYVIWYTGEKTRLIALSHQGELRWDSEFGGIEAKHGGGSSLVLTDKFVVFTREQEEGSSFRSSWVAVDKSTGNTAWELERDISQRNSFSTPQLVKNDRQESQLIFTSEAHGFTGVDPATGRVLWENKGLLTHRVVASPVCSRGLVLGCRKGQAVALEVDLNSHKVAPEPRYSLPPNLSPYVPTPLVFNDLLFLCLDNGSVACVRFATGELIWKERPAGPLYGSPVCVDGILYVLSKAGQFIAIRASTEYELLGIQDLGEGSFSTPVMGESGMVLRSFSRLRLLSP